MGDVRELVRPRRSLVRPVMLQQQRGEPSSSVTTRKRARPSAPLPPPPLLPPVTRRTRTPRQRRRRDDELQQSGRSQQDERESSPSRGDYESSESSGGSASGAAADDVVLLARRVVQELQPPAEEEDRDSSDDDDDDRPIRIVPTAALRRPGSTTTTAPTPVPAPRQPPSPPPSLFNFDDDDITSSVIKNVTVDNSSSVLDCTICYHPLKSPIFQCTAGHVVCSPCHVKLEEQSSTSQCHICRVPTPGGYTRCNAMEKVVDAIRVPCPYAAAHGCAETTLPYHDRDAHAETCAHRPCHCPADGCGFVGNVQTTLLQHFAAVHGWPCTARSTARASSGDDFDVRLRKGINVVTATTEKEETYTLVLNVERAAPVCDAITAFCIHPASRTAGPVRFGLTYYRRWRLKDDSDGGDGGLSSYLQSSHLQVVCTDLSDGMPPPGSCFPLLVPRWSAATGPGGETVMGDDISITVNYVTRGGGFL